MKVGSINKSHIKYAYTLSEPRTGALPHHPQPPHPDTHREPGPSPLTQISTSSSLGPSLPCSIPPRPKLSLDNLNYHPSPPHHHPSQSPAPHQYHLSPLHHVTHSLPCASPTLTRTIFHRYIISHPIPAPYITKTHSQPILVMQISHASPMSSHPRPATPNRHLSSSLSFYTLTHPLPPLTSHRAPPRLLPPPRRLSGLHASGWERRNIRLGTRRGRREVGGRGKWQERGCSSRSEEMAGRR